MSDNSQRPEKSEFSLKAEIQKRKTQATMQALEERRYAAARGEQLPRSNDPHRTTQTAAAIPTGEADTEPRPSVPGTSRLDDFQRTTQSLSSPPDFKRQSQPISIDKPGSSIGYPGQRRLTSVQKQLLIGAVAATLIVMICLGTTLVVSNQPARPTPTFRALPLVAASDVVVYLKMMGVPITDAHALSVAGSFWAAQDGIQFSVHQGNQSGNFIVLSYESSDRKVPDVFKASSSNQYKTWKSISVSNILVLISPSTSPVIRDAMGSHLTQFLLAPYRPNLPTATPGLGS